MELDELSLALELMSAQDLSRFARRCLCMSMYQKGSIEDIDIAVALDMIYVECCRRDNERLYDMALESVTSHPEVCDAA